MLRITRVISVISLILLPLNSILAEDSPNPTSPKQLLSSEDAIKKALDYTGLDMVEGFVLEKSLASVNLTTLKDSTTPFIGEELNNKEAWLIEFKGLILEFTNAIPGLKYEHPKDFKIFIDPISGQLLKVIIQTQGIGVNDISPKATAISAEEQIRGRESKYHGFFKEVPKVTLYEALNNVYGSPLLAKEIVAVLVLYSKISPDPKPVWDIHLYGIPPRPSRPGQNSPIYLRNHMRSIIDVINGKLWFATSTPQPNVNEED